jgi:hypothetical protein
MKQKKQMSIESDKKIEDSTSYLQKLKNAFKKITKPLILIIVLLFLNIGSKFPVMSNENSPLTPEEIFQNEQLEIQAEYERYVKMYQEIYEKSLIQQIEFESEVIIPEHFDFKYVEYIYDVSEELKISTRVAFRLIYKESTFNDTVVSSAGAKGLMQLMDNTRKKYYNELRVDTMNLDKNQEDIYIGLYYLTDLSDYWYKRGNSEKNLLKLSLAAYNAGLSRVIQYKGVPPYKETQAFVTFILKPHSNPIFYANILKKNTNTIKDVS